MDNKREKLSKPLTVEDIKEDLRTLYEQAGYPVRLPPHAWRAVCAKSNALRARWLDELLDNAEAKDDAEYGE